MAAQFTQEDPIGIAGGLNLYGFANGDPVNFSDPFGLNPCLIPSAARDCLAQVKATLADAADQVLVGLGKAAAFAASFFTPGPDELIVAPILSRSVGTFRFADRVSDQLNDSRLGSLAGRFTLDDIQDIANNPNSRAFFDAKNGTVNIVQEIDGVLLRITSERDEMLIKSVGRLRPRQLENGLESGRFVPIGGGN